MDTQAALTEANQAFNELLQVLENIPADKINTMPFEGSWTAGQDVQHILLSLGGFVKLLNGPVKDTGRDPEQKVATIRNIMLNFDHKMHSPDFIVPEEKEYDKAQLLSEIKTLMPQYLKAIETADTTKTCLAFELPGLGHITRAEGIAFVNVHTIRHTHQLKNIAAALGI